MGFSRQHWSGLPFPPAGDLPDSGIESMSLTCPALAGGFFTTSATWEAPNISLFWHFPGVFKPQYTYLYNRDTCFLHVILRLGLYISEVLKTMLGTYRKILIDVVLKKRVYPSQFSRATDTALTILLLLCQRRQWHPTPVLLPGKSHGRRSLVG